MRGKLYEAVSDIVLKYERMHAKNSHADSRTAWVFLRLLFYKQFAYCSLFGIEYLNRIKMRKLLNLSGSPLKQSIKHNQIVLPAVKFRHNVNHCLHFKCMVGAVCLFAGRFQIGFCRKPFGNEIIKQWRELLTDGLFGKNLLQFRL